MGVVRPPSIHIRSETVLQGPCDSNSVSVRPLPSPLHPKHLISHANITSSYLTLNQVGRSCFHVYSAVRPFLRRSSHLLWDHGLNALPDGALTPVGTPLLHNRSDRPVRSVVSGCCEQTSISIFRPSVFVCTHLVRAGIRACGCLSGSRMRIRGTRRSARSGCSGMPSVHPIPTGGRTDPSAERRI